MAEVERERDELLAVLTERYNGILGHIVAQFDLRQNDLMNLHGTLETVESTLVSIEETLYRGKAMRSVIMWESQNLHKQGLESLRKLELELNVQCLSYLGRNRRECCIRAVIMNAWQPSTSC